MAIADKLLQLNQVKQDIKTAIETKGIPMTNVAFTEYANKILDISGGGEVLDEYFYYSKAYYTVTNNSTLFSNAWQDMKDSETVLFDIPLMLVAPNQDIGGMTIDIYVGTNGQLQALYDACVNETIPLPSSGNLGDIYLINNVAVKYYGEISGDIGFPIPLFEFGSMDDANGFIIGDLTPLSMGLGLVLAKIVNVSIPNNNIIIQQGFEVENESGIIIPNSVTSIGNRAFSDWTSNTHPLVIPNSVTSIGDSAFYNWKVNNHPLVIPNSVTSIGDSAFYNWKVNNHPLVIPNSVTSIGGYAFSDWTSNNQPLVIPNSVTNIGRYAFYGWSSNNQPLVIPNSVTNIGRYAFYGWSSNNQPLVIPNSVTEIREYAFYRWETNNQPLTIPNSVTIIGSYAFYGWSSNNQPLTIPNSVAEIGNNAFHNWSSNNQPLVIPDSVTSIGNQAFLGWALVPYVEMKRTTPPTLADRSAFDSQNNAPIYVPDASVTAYKTATNWVNLASRIFPISDK